MKSKNKYKDIAVVRLYGLLQENDSGRHIEICGVEVLDIVEDVTNFYCEKKNISIENLEKMFKLSLKGSKKND